MIGQNPVAVTMPPYSQYPTSDPPGYGGPYGGEGDGIALTLKFFPLAFALSFFKPVVTVNGQPYQVPWNRRTVIPLPPGQYHVHIHTPYLIPSKVGNADLPVNVGGGRPVELEYRAPVWVWAPGALGSPPQKYNGALLGTLIVAVAIAIPLICCCVGVLSNLFGDSTG
jgi:hypothetical protein